MLVPGRLAMGPCVYTSDPSAQLRQNYPGNKLAFLCTNKCDRAQPGDRKIIPLDRGFKVSVPLLDHFLWKRKVSQLQYNSPRYAKNDQRKHEKAAAESHAAIFPQTRVLWKNNLIS